MRRAAVLLVLLLAVGAVVQAQVQFPSYSGVAAGLPACVTPGVHYTITNASSNSDCTSGGGGSSHSECVCLGGSWISSAAGTGTGSVTSVTCGTGLTGGTITTSGTCAVNFGSTSSTVAAGSNKTNGPSGAKYDPLRANTANEYTTSSDEFIGGTTASFTWGNQGSTTATAELDTIRVSVPAAAAPNSRRCMWYATPPSGDFFLVASVGAAGTAVYASNSLLFGVAFLESGSIATPTSYSGLMVSPAPASSGTTLFWLSATSYTASNTVNSSVALTGRSQQIGAPLYVGLQYVSSTKAETPYYSYDGYSWLTLGTSRTLSAAPVNVGLCGDDNTINVAFDFRVYFQRVMTSVAGTTAPYFQIGS